MSLVLDAGALIAYDRGDPRTCALLESAARQRIPVRTTAAVVAQVWRDGARQAVLARLLSGVDERPVTPTDARRIGILLGRSGLTDVVDASVVDVAVDGDEILTSDPGDLTRLATAAGRLLTITPV